LGEQGGPIDGEQQSGVARADGHQAICCERSDRLCQFCAALALDAYQADFGGLSAAEGGQDRPQLTRQPFAEPLELGQQVGGLGALPQQRVAVARGDTRGPKGTFRFHWMMKERKWTLSTPPKPSVVFSTSLIAAVRRFCSCAFPSGE